MLWSGGSHDIHRKERRRRHRLCCVLNHLVRVSILKEMKRAKSYVSLKIFQLCSVSKNLTHRENKTYQKKVSEVSKCGRISFDRCTVIGVWCFSKNCATQRWAQNYWTLQKYWLWLSLVRFIWLSICASIGFSYKVTLVIWLSFNMNRNSRVFFLLNVKTTCGWQCFINKCLGFSLANWCLNSEKILCLYWWSGVTQTDSLVVS